MIYLIDIFADDQKAIGFPDSRLILDLPIEIIQDVVFEYLTCKDIRSLTMVGSKRLKEISEDHLNRTCSLDCKFHKLFLVLIQ